MPEKTGVSADNLDPAQAAELALLVDLEARWENLRFARSRAPEVRSSTQDLQAMQKAYEAFHSKLAAFNKRYAPAHIPELLLNNPVRLGLWCQRMRDLFMRVENNPQVRCPVHLIEKAYRWADQVAARVGKDRLSRPTPPGDMQTVIRELEAIGVWCGDLAKVVTAS